MLRFKIGVAGVAVFGGVAAIGMAAASAQSQSACEMVRVFGLARFSSATAVVEQCKRDIGERGEKGRSAPSGGPDSATSADLDYVRSAGERGRAIYVKDDRIEAADVGAKVVHPKISAVQRSVKATAALINRSKLQSTQSGWRLQLEPFRPFAGLPLCQNESFAKQRVGSYCTAFLIAPNLVATAGHCIDWGNVDVSDPSRNTYAIVFGFELRNGAERQDFTQDEVYQIGRIIERYREGNNETLRDFAVLELQESVAPRIAQPLRLAGTARMKVEVDTQLGVMGHPSGLAKKVSFISETNRALEEGSPTEFRGQLNTFHGNSGSPVLFYDEPDVVAGILVAGEDDYFIEGQCARTAVYASTEMCNGRRCSERVTKSALIEPYVPD
jgi:V8-like Glu-specific endopeptidase